MILVNARFSWRRTTGVERYSHEILQRLDVPLRLLKPPIGMAGPAGHLWEQIVLPTQVHPDDLLWSPANTGPISVPNQVISLQDLSPIDHPETFNRTFRMWYRYLIPKLLEKVRRVTTVSEFSKLRILDNYGISESKIEIIPGGVDREVFKPSSPDEIESVREKWNLPNNYILSIATIEPRKNLKNLIKAWGQTTLAADGFQLVIGGGSGSAFQRVRTESPGISGVRFLGYLPDVDLAPIYSGASLFVYASFYEGFGLPILEAMACGTPVLAADSSALPEVAGNAAIYTDPYNPSELADRIQEIVGDTAICDSLRRKGFARCELFSWDNASRHMADLLEAL